MIVDHMNLVKGLLYRSYLANAGVADSTLHAD